MSEDYGKDMVDTGRFKIDLLRSDNYFMWSSKMHLVLRSKGVWKILLNEERPLATEKNATTYERRKCIA